MIPAALSHDMIRSGSILVTGETVFGRRLSGHLLKVVQKLLSLLKPVWKQTSLMGISEKFRRYFALFTRVRITYSCGENPVSF